MSGVAEDSHLQSNKKLPVIRGELALVIVILINSLGVVLMLYSGSGISAISSVPYAFSEVFPHVTLGTWTYIFQGLLILSLMIMRKNSWYRIYSVLLWDLYSVRCWIFMKRRSIYCRLQWDSECFIL